MSSPHDQAAQTVKDVNDDKETNMEEASVLDEAFERMASAGFELPNGFVNHGAMACEALASLGFDEAIDEWSQRFARIAGPGVTPQAAVGFEWRDALGDYRRLPEWIGYFDQAIDTEGWPNVVETWVPRLLPALSTALFHGAIRTAHAVRAIAAVDTVARRRELARALGYWAARFRPGQPVAEPLEVDEVRDAVARAAAGAARYYLGAPGIPQLHGVTGAMAVELLAPHITARAAADGLAQVQVEHAALYAGIDPVTDVPVSGVSDAELASVAEASNDPHQVKLVEACRRGSSLTGDPAFAAAAETVTSRPGRR